MKLSGVHFHFIGIGGVGMCGLAELLVTLGAKVTGSDLNNNTNTEHLEKIGVHIYLGHRAENVPGSDVVVFSSAVAKSNPEVMAAKELKIPLIHRSEALAEVMRLKRGICVAGTHGKTTTTSMIATVLLKNDFEPTVYVGGKFSMINSTAILGRGEWMVAESDESDGSFLRLSPEISVITNIDCDHMEYFETRENLEKHFFQFASRIPFYGQLIACGDDRRVRDLFSEFPKKCVFYGFSENNDFVLKGSDSKYEVWHKQEILTKLEVPISGRHNALNALAAMLAGRSVGIDIESAAKSILFFNGVERRFQFKGEAKGVHVYDDYGHHPTEIKATLQAFKEKFPSQRLIVVFQPHRYSRTKYSWNEFLNCFNDCDALFLLDIYPAGENPIEGISSERLFQEINFRNKFYFQTEDMVHKIRTGLQPSDIVLTLGAGDGWKLGLNLLKALSES